MTQPYYKVFCLCAGLSLLSSSWSVKAAPVEQRTGDSEAAVEHGDDTLRRLGRDLRALQAFVYKYLGSEESPAEAIKDMPKDAASLLFDKVMALQAQVSKLTGQLEEQEHRLQHMQKDAQIDKKFLEERIAHLEARLAGNAPAEGAAPAPAASGEPLSAEGLYEEAQRLMKAHRTAEAEAHLRTIYEKFPDSPVFTKACLDLVVLTEAQGKDTEAAAFAMVIYKKHPSSGEAQQALLKMATLLKKLKQPEEACSVVHKLLATENLQSEFKTMGETLKADLKCE